MNKIKSDIENIQLHPPKLQPYCINLFISSILMIISSILLFFCRTYNKNWVQDMLPFYLMESFSNTSIITIPFFYILLKTEITFTLFGVVGFFESAGIIFSIFSFLFKLYLFLLSFADYFEYEEYKINKNK